MSDEEPFLSRWSRRKVEAREQPAADPLPASTAQGLPTAKPLASELDQGLPKGTSTESHVTELPSLDSLRGLQSEYREFLKPDVDPATQRAALKKLFGDPHFNQMDGLDVYIDDYNKFEPMGAAISATLAANKYLRVVDHLLSEQQAKEAKVREAAQPRDTNATVECAGETPDPASRIPATQVDLPLISTAETPEDAPLDGAATAAKSGSSGEKA